MTDSEKRLLKLLTASPEQLAAIDELLAGKLPRTRSKPTGPLLMGMGAAAARLGVSRATLWRMIKAGKLERVEVLRGSFRVRCADLEAFAEGPGT
jgi:excisionase family DNA binding protein